MNKQIVQDANRTILEWVETGQMEKVAQANTTYIRTKLMERGFLRRIVPLEPCPGLDPQVDSDMPSRIIELEPESPGAVSMPIGGKIGRHEIKTGKVLLVYHKIATPRHYINETKLRTYRADLRSILSDKDQKNMEYAEDASFIALVNSVIGTANNVVPEAGVPLWRTFSGGLTRVNFAESLKILGSTKSHFPTVTALLNNNTIKEFLKWDLQDLGTEILTEVTINGIAERKFMGINLLVTIKSDIIPDGTIYYFADREFLGIFEYLRDATMWMKKEADEIEWYTWEEVGFLLKNVTAVARADFSTS